MTAAYQNARIGQKNNTIAPFQYFPYDIVDIVTRAPLAVHYTPFAKSVGQQERNTHSCARHAVLTEFIIL